MVKRYIVSRVMHCLQTTSIKGAASEAEAIEKARKLKRDEWRTVDADKRSDYKAMIQEM